MLDYPRDNSRARNMETGNVPDDRDGDDERPRRGGLSSHMALWLGKSYPGG